MLRRWMARVKTQVTQELADYEHAFATLKEISDADPASIDGLQYFTDLPVALVLLHMLGAVLTTAFTARLVWAVRGPATEAPLVTPSEAAAAR